MSHYLAASCDDYRRLAERRLPRFLFDYIDGGAGGEHTLAANCRDFQRVRLRQRVLCDVENPDTRCELIGQSASMPVALAPLGMAGLYARRGEAQAARAAAAFGVPFSLSTVGICSLAEVQAASGKNSWFQLYMLRDREAVQGLLQQALANGCDTLLFTVDLPVAGIRRRDIRNGMLDPSWRGKLAKARQLAQRPGWLLNVDIRGKPHHFGNLTDQVADPNDLRAFKVWLDAQFDPRVTWGDIRWLRQQWPGKLILKGILEPGDALQALDCGADGIVISNHGGRQLDGVSSTVRQLPVVAEALNGRLPILLDGGIRSGMDILKALALGAQGVMIGRPWAWALAAGGEAAVTRLLAGLQCELAVAMALCGVKDLEQIDGSLVDWL
ncbi:L-lactate dehydrogenase [Pseudomonas saudiphocaensis]|uniref:L-lactate dehydrogenase n=1 Tax=Pseudomonas saudiphocaensis TaxID=1499686 RepID=UPI00187D65FA|nr:L-lactate dehydrogenase [Pseudomonas saudiphocaensis]MBE7926925.1 L-lactate dehydrogenase [Pseudomonas saudiphocaensis]